MTLTEILAFFTGEEKTNVAVETPCHQNQKVGRENPNYPYTFSGELNGEHIESSEETYFLGLIKRFSLKVTRKDNKTIHYSGRNGDGIKLERVVVEDAGYKHEYKKDEVGKPILKLANTQVNAYFAQILRDKAEKLFEKQNQGIQLLVD